MSIRLMSLIFEKEKNTTGSKRLVLLAIADNANDEGVCWPAITTIARKANISRAYAKQLVHELKDDGYIQITRRPRKDNRDETNLYRIMPLWVGEAGLPLPGVGVPQIPQVGEAGLPQRGSQGYPESSLEPSIKPPLTTDVGNQISPMITRVSGMAAIPPKEMQRIEQLISMVQSYGLEEIEAALKRCCDRWRKTPRKNGSGFYSVTTMGWVDWAQDELVGKPPEEEKPIVIYVPPPPSKPAISLKEYREKQRECNNTVSTT